MGGGRYKIPEAVMPRCKFVCKECRHTQTWIEEVNKFFVTALVNKSTLLKERLVRFVSENCEEVVIKHYCEATPSEHKRLLLLHKDESGATTTEELIDWLNENIGAVVFDNKVIFLAFDMSAYEAAKRVIHEMFHIARIITDKEVGGYLTKRDKDVKLEEREEMLAFYAQELLFCTRKNNTAALGTMWDLNVPILIDKYKYAITISEEELLEIMDKVVPSY